MEKDQLPHLETFARAAELSSFTAAARELGMTQAAVSQRIQMLEQSLGVPRFARQAGHVLLTDAGRRLYEFAMRILERHREPLKGIGGHPAPLAGGLPLGVPPRAGGQLL